MDFLQQFGAAVPEACCTEGTLILTQMEVLNLVSGYGLLSKPFDPTREHPGYNSSVHPPKSSCQDKPLNNSKLLVNQPHRYPPLAILTLWLYKHLTKLSEQYMKTAQLTQTHQLS